MSLSLLAVLEAVGLAALAGLLVRQRRRHREALLLVDESASQARHDLRTPTTAIKGFALLLKTKWRQLPDEKREEYLGLLVSETERLCELADQYRRKEKESAPAP